MNKNPRHISTARFAQQPEKRRLDIASFGGVSLAAGCIVCGLVFEGGKIADVQQGTAALIVFGGTIGAVLVTTPFEIFLAAVRRTGDVLFTHPSPFKEMLKKILALSDGSRRSGAAYLESEAIEIVDPFLKKGINLVADGTPYGEIQTALQTDIEIDAERAESEIAVWESAGGYAPTFGIVGAVLGLIQVMKHLDNLDEVGRGVAVAFVATIYGVASANLLFLPIAGKIRARDRVMANLHEMMLLGILAISEGINPRVVEIRLEHFVEEQIPARTPVRRVRPAVSKVVTNP